MFVGIPAIVAAYSVMFTPYFEWRVVSNQLGFTVWHTISVVYPLYLSYKIEKKESAHSSIEESFYREVTDIEEKDTGFPLYPHIAKFLVYPGTLNSKSYDCLYSHTT